MDINYKTQNSKNIELNRNYSGTGVDTVGVSAREATGAPVRLRELSCTDIDSGPADPAREEGPVPKPASLFRALSLGVALPEAVPERPATDNLGKFSPLMPERAAAALSTAA